MRPTGRGTAALFAAFILVGFSACGDQDRIGALETQVDRLQSSNSELIGELRSAEARKKKAQANLDWARDNVSLLRDEVASLRNSLSSTGTEDYGYSGGYESDSYDYGSGSSGYSDGYSGFDRDCSDYSYDNFDPGYGDPYGLDADGDGIACES